MKFSFFWVLLLFVVHTSLHAVSPEMLSKVQEAFPGDDRKVRINSLWPSDLLMRLPIEPMIPKDFVLKVVRPKGTDVDYYLWGAPEVLDAFDTNDFSTLKKPILVLRLSYDVAQTGPQSFSGVAGLEKGFKGVGFTSLSHKIVSWGDYPVLTFNGICQEKVLACAWIGLNYSSWVVFARLAYPGTQKGPTSEDLQLWKTFITKTNILPEPDVFLVQGIDMQSGYTRIERGSAKLTCVVERRKRDSAVQVVMVPTAAQVSCAFLKMDQGLSGTQLRRGEELVKVFAKVSQRLSEGGSLEIPDCVIPVFIKTVDEFSLDKSKLQGEPDILVHQTILKPL